MKYINSDNLPDKKIETNDTFRFLCHDKLACFNKCCRNLNLFLYPYDILRIKNRLEISSDLFLDKYVDIVLRPSNFFPEVLLSMSDNKDKTCPFLSEYGCLIYQDRPDTCRTFPVEQGMFFDAENDNTVPVYFFRPPDFCLGQHENKSWTVATWAKDQNASLYNQMTALWAELKSLFQTDPFNGMGLHCQKGKMAFMATYNIDIFRSFVFQSSFLKRYKINSVIKKKIKKNDVELMKMGFEWVKLFLWGIKSSSLKIR